jgi:DNA-binding NarL/FixJ family response regulator
LLATDDAESAEPLRSCLAPHPELTIVGCATQVESMLALAVRLRPDVVVIALLYTVRTSALLRAIPAHAPAFEQIAGRVILVAGIAPEPGRRIAAACGASGYVPQAAIADELPDAVAHVARGGSWPLDDPGPAHRRR